MTQKTTNYNLEKYDATDAPNLQAQYNRSMDILDTKVTAEGLPFVSTTASGD